MRSLWFLLVLLALLPSPRVVAQAGTVRLSHVAGPLAEAPLRAAIMAKIGRLEACLAARGEEPAVAGVRLSVRVMVSSDGGVVATEVQDAAHTAVEECVKQVLEGVRYAERAGFTTFVVALSLGDPPAAAGDARAQAPRATGPGSLTLSLTQVRGELRPSVARRGFVAALSRLRACFAAATRRGETPPARLHLVVAVDGSGRVARVGARDAELSRAFERCLDGAVRAQRFAAPAHGVAELSQGLRYTR